MPEKSAGDSTLEQQILDFLINKYSPEKDKRIRLKPNKQDKMHFEMLFENDKNLDTTSNIISNYYFFVEKMKACGGIIVTASHNPKEWNGMKLVGKNAIPMSGLEIKKRAEKYFSL